MKFRVVIFLFLILLLCTKYVRSQSPCSSAGIPALTFGSTSCPGTATSTTPTLTWTVSGNSPNNYDVYISKYPYGVVNDIPGYVQGNATCVTTTSHTVPANRLVPGMLYRYNVDAATTCNGNCYNLSSTGQRYFHVPPILDTICQNGNLVCSTTAQSPGSGAVVLYSWQLNGNTLTSTSSNTFTPTQTGSYSVKVVYAGSSHCAATVTNASNTINITSLSCGSTSCNNVSVSSHPSNQTVNVNGTATFSVNVNGTTPFSYIWQVNTGTSWTTLTNSGSTTWTSGTTGSTLSVTGVSSAMNGFQYRCFISNSCPSVLFSNAATLTVSSGCSLSIASQPTNQSVFAGQTATFTVTPSGTGPFTYGWIYSNNGIGWSAIPIGNYTWNPSGSSGTLTITNASIVQNGYLYRAMMSNGCGAQQVSNIVQLTVTTQQPPVVLSISATAHEISAGASVSFSASVTNNPTSYNWTIQGGCSGTSTNATGATPTVTFNKPGNYLVKLQASNSGGASNLYTTVNGYIRVKPTSSGQCPPGPSYTLSNSKLALDPINLATGAYEYKHTDISIPAINTDLNFTRYYNSANSSRNSALGYGWSHTYDVYIDILGDTLWNVHYGDGHITPYIPSHSGNGDCFALYNGVYDSLHRDNSTGTFLLKLKTGEKYNFNSSGLLTSIVDLNGNTTTLNYSGGKLVSVVAPGGRTLTFTYNASWIHTVTDPLGRTVKYFTNADNLTRVDDFNSEQTGYTYTGHYLQRLADYQNHTVLVNDYDSDGRVISQSDYFNRHTFISYNTPVAGATTVTYPDNHTLVAYHDEFYRLTKEIESGAQKLYTYDYNSSRISETNENGVTTTYTYDERGNQLSVIKPYNTVSASTYNSLNKPTRVIGPVEDTIQMSYDNALNLTSLILPGATKTFTYYSNGLIKSSTDARNNTTNFTYNNYGDLISVISPSGTKAFTYDAAGRLLTETDENSHTTTYTYNNYDRVVAVKDALNQIKKDSFDANNNLVVSIDKKGLQTIYGYDNKNRLKQIINSRGFKRVFAYDSMDNLSSITDENGNIVSYIYDTRRRLTRISTPLGTTRFGYDAVGNKIADTNALGNVKRYYYDSLNRLIRVKDELDNETNISYNKNDQVSGITDPLTHTTVYSYNKRGLLTTVLDAVSNTTVITYDSNGNRLSLKDPNGHTQYFNYDASNRLTTHIDAEGNADSFAYDGVGNLVFEKKPDGGTIVRTYDAIDRLTAVTNTGGNNYGYTYDANDNLLSMTNNTGTSIFSYDSLNLLKQYTDMFGNVVKYTYDSVGNRITIIYPGNKTVSYQYNDDNLLTKVTDWLTHSTNYSYDAAGRLLKMQRPNGDTCLYTYNNANNLLSLTNKITASIIHKSSFTLDDNGNRTDEERIGLIPYHLTAASFRYSYGDDDRLVSDSVFTYTNNAAGSRTSGAGYSYNFAVDNILNSVTTSNGTTTYRYDANGNRVEKIKPGFARRYVLDVSGTLAQVLQEQDTSGVVKASYIYGLGLIARIDSANKTSYYHFDAQHNTVALTNDTGLVTNTYVYDPFGVLLKHTGSSQQPFTFLGEYGVQQEDTSLYYVRARYYDAAKGRFLSKDIYPASIMNPQKLHRYVYGLNSPLMNIDPTGLFNWRSLGIGVLQGVAGAGKLAQAGLSIIGAASSGGIFGTLAINSAGSSINDAIKDFRAAGSNIWNSNNDIWEWKESNDFSGLLDFVYDDPLISAATKIAGIASGVNGLVYNIDNILVASNYTHVLPLFSGQALQTSTLLIPIELFGLFESSFSLNHQLTSEYMNFFNSNNSCDR